MSQESIEVVQEAIAAVNDRDIERYLACCTEDIQLYTPTAAIGGVYDGPEGIRRFFADLADAGPDFHLGVERLEAVGPDQVLVFVGVSVSGRASGISTPMKTANVYDLVDGKIKRARVFLDRQEALEAVGLGD